MSKYDGIRFCDKCGAAVPKGDNYHESLGKEYCTKCNKKGLKWRILLVCAFVGMCFTGGFKTYEDTSRRIDTNATEIHKNTQRIVELNAQTARTFAQVSIWASNIEADLNELFARQKFGNDHLRQLAEEMEERLAMLRSIQDKLLTDVSKGRFTDKHIQMVLASLLQQVKQVDATVKVLMKDPEAIMEQMVKPTVGVGVRNMNGTRIYGSGVLFRKVRVRNKITGDYAWRYYGFTAYHVLDSLIVNNDKVEASRIDNPGQNEMYDNLLEEVVVFHYGGQSKQPKTVFAGVKILHPQDALGRFIPVQDMLVFSFITKKELATATLATDAEIRANIRYGSPMYTTGIAVIMTPCLYSGSVANPAVPGNGGILFHTYGYFGQSGGPIFDAVTMKVISVNQRAHVMRGRYGGQTVDTSVLFGYLLTDIRRVWHLSAPMQYKKLLDAPIPPSKGDFTHFDDDANAPEPDCIKPEK